jgi:hypothetical protein
MPKSKKANPYTGAKGFWIDKYGDRSPTETERHNQYWASEFEYLVYLELTKYFSPKQISRQYSVRIKPKCSLFPERKWLIDFLLTVPNGDNYRRYLIEAKGAWIFQRKADLTLLRYNLELLHIHNPLCYPELVIVGMEERCLHKPVKIQDYRIAIKQIYQELNNGS